MESGVWGVAVAALGAAAVGLERQWSGHAGGPHARFAGLRTFTLLGAGAGLAGWLWRLGFEGFALLVAATLGLLIVIAYWVASQHEVDATTEMAAVVVLAAGVLSGVGQARLASGLFALVALLLAEKSQLHAWVSRLDDVGLRAGLRFGVMAVVVLPLLPEGPLGPLGLQPRAVWLLVLFFSGVSFAGFVARRLLGPDPGYWATGLMGGLVSSTNVTLTFARLSRSYPDFSLALATGTMAANAVLFPRVWLATAVLNPELAGRLWPWLLPAFLVSVLILALTTRRSDGQALTGTELENPLQLGAALQMAVSFQLVLVIVAVVRRAWGRAGVLGTAALLGMTDVDALTMSMSRTPELSTDVATTAVVIGVLANTVLKATLALALGSSLFRRRTALALVAIALALLASLSWKQFAAA